MKNITKQNTYAIEVWLVNISDAENASLSNENTNTTKDISEYVYNIYLVLSES
jgi:hypothetical protein